MLIPPLRCPQETNKIVSFLKKTIKQAGFTKAVIATSGGIDSSTVLALTCRALNPTNVISLRLPYQAKHTKTAYQNSILISKFLKIPRRNQLEMKINTTVDQTWKNILIELSHSQTGLSPTANQVRLGNIMARTRMIYLYDTAKAKNALVVGTENRTEHLLGYFTRFGDAASDLEPITHLFKTQVRDLARFLQLPEPIISAPPTAGLWEGQTDEEELGFKYEAADQVLYLSIDKKMSPAQIAKKLYKDNPKKSEIRWRRTVNKVLDRVNKSHFKLVLPYSL